MERRKTRPGEPLRVPLEQAIGLRFKHPGDFVDELAANLSTGGMFIRTRRPHPVGSVFEFELRLGGDRPRIAGKAQVAWVRRRGDTLDAPAGMGVRFVELDDANRRHVAELVAAHEAQGGRSRDLDAPQEGETAAAAPGRGAAAARPETTAPAPPPAASPPPPAGRAAFASERRRSRGLWILLPIALAAALAAGLWLRPGPAPPPPAEAAATEPEAPPAAPAADGARDGLEAEGPDPVRAVNDWARAWTEQRVDDYLAAYSLRFAPADGLDRAAWERQRRQRLLTPEWIKVELALVEVETTGTDRSRVRFVQVYESDGYRDVVHKVLDLEREGGGWRIARETVEP